MQIKEPGFVAAREAANTELDQLRKTAIDHPNPERATLIRKVTSTAIMAINIATSIEQVAGILRNAKADLEANVKPISKAAA